VGSGGAGGGGGSGLAGASTFDLGFEAGVQASFGQVAITYGSGDAACGGSMLSLQPDFTG
jgi:hypothetical protein